jgi:hypothetical protein
MLSVKKLGSRDKSDRKRQTITRELKEKDHVRNRQLWSKYFAEKLSVNGIVLRKGRTAGIRRQLENNKDYWRGVLVGDGTGRTQ